MSIINNTNDSMNGFTDAHSQIRRRSLRLVQCISIWKRRFRQRQDLHDLNDRQLEDIGLDSVTVKIETKKPFWRA